MNRLLHHRRARIAFAILSGVLFYFGLRLTPVWWAALLAPVPLLLAAFHASAREARLLSWLASAIGLSSYCAYYVKTTGPLATVLLLILQILLWTFFVIRTRTIVRSSRHWLILFAYPSLIAGADTLISYFSPHGTWGSFAYTQMRVLPMIQIASIFGAPGIVFLASLITSTIAVALYYGVRLARPLFAYGLPVLLIAAGLGYGQLRLHLAQFTSSQKIGIVVIDDFLADNPSSQQALAVWQAYDRAVTQLASQGAHIIVLPEKIVALAPDSALQTQSALSALAQRSQTFLVVGLQINRSDRKDNVSWLFSPDGELLAEYRKQHMVPYLENDLTPGHQEIVKNIDGVPYGLAICRDLIFADFGRTYGRLGVSAMLVPAWDFYRDSWMASEVATLRGVENGYAVIRAGRESYLHGSDCYGRILAQQRSDFLPGTTLLLTVPLAPAAPTFYSRFGNKIVWLFVLALLLALLFPLRRISQLTFRVAVAPSSKP